MGSVGRPREFSEDRVTKALRIDRALDERLKQAARERGVSVNVVATMALEDYLARLLPLSELMKTAS